MLNEMLVNFIKEIFPPPLSEIVTKCNMRVRVSVIPGRSDGVGRTEWGSFLGRGWGQPPQGSSPNAAPDPTTTHRTSESDPKLQTFHSELFPQYRKKWMGKGKKY